MLLLNKRPVGGAGGHWSSSLHKRSSLLKIPECSHFLFVSSWLPRVASWGLPVQGKSCLLVPLVAWHASAVQSLDITALHELCPDLLLAVTVWVWAVHHIAPQSVVSVALYGTYFHNRTSCAGIL